MEEQNNGQVVKEEGDSSAQDAKDAQTDDRQEQTGGQSGAATSRGNSCGKNNTVIAYPQDVVLAATSLALALSKGRSQYEIETLINLFSLTTNNLQSILAQILINKRVQDFLETPL